MITKFEALEYECFGTKWYGYVYFNWARRIVARMLNNKVDKKYALYEEYMLKKEAEE